MKLSFLECYQILEISDDCDWLMLRKKYKSLIQRYHPDRFTAGSAEQLAAEKTIRSYNAAYKLIADYYKTNKTLPPRLPQQAEITGIPHTPRKKRPPVSPQASYKKNDHQIKRFSLAKSVLILTSLSSLYLVSIFISDTTPTNPPVITIAKMPLTNYSILTDKSDTATPAKDLINIKQYFTSGSSLGDVIIIQGQPTRTEGNVWYYGESTVTFNNGVVSNWFRHPDFPLYVRIIEPATDKYKSKKPATTKQGTTKHPYWGR